MTLPTGAALGTTQDPKQLIKGEPSEVSANAERLTSESTRIKGLAGRVDQVAVDGWSEGIGRPAYDAKRSAEQDKWKVYGDLLAKAGATLSTYAGSLTTAQSKAADAIAKWNEGETATANAQTAYQHQVDTYNAYVNRPVAVPSYGAGPTPPSMGPSRPGPFVDPGEALRQEAQDILDAAREALEAAGGSALEELGALPGAKTEGSSGPSASGSVEGPSFSWDGFEEAFGKDPSKGKDGKYDGDPDAVDSPFKISLGKVEGQAAIWGAEGSVEDYWGDVKVDADGSVTFGGVSGSAEATLDANGLTVGADATATLVGVEGHAGAEYGYAEVGVDGTASVEATANGEARIGVDGVHAGGEVFAGAKAEVSASGDVGGVGGEVGAEGWAGFGASGDIDAGFDDGKFTIGGSGGLAFGLGGKLSGSVTIDVGEVGDTLGDIADGIGGFFS